MSKIDNPPLIETILEIRWGETSPNNFQFSQQEETLLPGVISSNASQQDYSIQEVIQATPHRLPHQVTLRLRKQKNKWPCLQVGLGVFTINQLGEGYDWDIFKKDILAGLNIFNESAFNLVTSLNTSTVTLRYQDAFYPDSSEHIDEYLKKHFNITPGLPIHFFDKNQNIENHIETINMQFKVPLSNNLGIVSIVIANAIINNKPGLLIETSVSNDITNITHSGFNVSDIMLWLEQAHDIQRHSFKTIIKESAYNGS